MRTIFIVIILILLMLFLGLCSSGLSGCTDQEIRWEKTNEGQWKATNLTCINENPLKYMCIDNCFEKSQIEMWNLCKDKGTIKRTTTNIEVLCFSSGCMPQVINNSCSLICPT